MRKLLGLLALAGALFVAAPAHRAEASVLTPGVATTVQGGTESLTTEVRWRRYRHWAPRRYYAPRVYVRRHYWRRRYW